MANFDGRKSLGLFVLQVLRQYTDNQRGLTQKEITEKIAADYGVKCSRRSVLNNLELLRDLGYDVDWGRGKKCRLKPSDPVLLCPRSPVDHKVLDALNDAIKDGRQISCLYNDVGTDGTLRPRKAEPTVINPYRLVENNGYLWLIANVDKYDTVSHWRVDKMSDVEKLKTGCKPEHLVPELRHRIDFPTYAAEHIYMFSDEVASVTLATTTRMMSILADWFGRGRDKVKVLGQDGGRLTVLVRSSVEAMRYWALQYGRFVEVLAPKSLREQVRQDLTEMLKKYNNHHNKEDETPCTN